MTKITTDNNFGEITKFGDLAIGDMFVCAWFPETAFIRIDDGKNGKYQHEIQEYFLFVCEMHMKKK